MLRSYRSSFYSRRELAPRAAQHQHADINDILTTLAAEGGRTPKINVEVTSLSSLVRMPRSGTYLSCFAKPIARMPDLGLALVPYKRRMLRGQAGVVLHRSLERYGPRSRAGGARDGGCGPDQSVT